MLILRTATLSDAEILRFWDTQPHVMDSDPNDDWNWEVELSRFPEWRLQLMAEWKGRPVGFMQVIDPALEETHYWGDIGNGYRAIDIWIGDAKDLGKGYGSLMMQQALDLCFGIDEVDEVLIDPLASNEKAIRFYQRLGFTFREERWFGQDFCHVYGITKIEWHALKRKA